MTGTAKVLRSLAFGFMTLFGVLGTMFVAGYAFTDLGTATAVAVTAAWVVPMVALSVLALRRPETALRVLAWLTGIVSVTTVLDSVFRIVPRDDWGPVMAVVVLALGVSLAFLGLHRTRAAGLLLVVLAGAQLAGTVLGLVLADGWGDGPGGRGMLSTSSGVVVLPILLTGVLFLMAASLAKEPRPRASRGGRRTRPRAAH